MSVMLSIKGFHNLFERYGRVRAVELVVLRQKETFDKMKKKKIFFVLWEKLFRCFDDVVVCI